MPLIIGYHTCEMRNGVPFVEANAPFRSEGITFLGEGHYLWQHHFQHGVDWGELHYVKKNKRYYVVKCEFKFAEAAYLDLYGNPEHEEIMWGLIEEAESFGYSGDLTLGAYIDWLRDLDDEIFPYSVIRCGDPSHVAEKVPFSPNSSKSVTLRNRVMVCYHQQHSVTLVRRKVVFASKYVAP